MKNQFDGGSALVEAFRKLGVEYILSSPGTEWAPVWEAMADQIHRKKSGPKLLDVWHETLAVDIAAGYTLATGRMQAVLLHAGAGLRSEEHTSELQSRLHLVCRLLLEKKNT